jgi:hypothetical protein
VKQRGDLLARWGPRLAVAAAVVFVISSVFPLAAGLSKNTAGFPKWWGTLDVAVAFLLALCAIVVLTLARPHVDRRAEKASYRALRILIWAVFAVLLLFFLAGDRIVWPNCLTGFAWRYWLLLYILPEWFTALRARTSPPPD